MVSDVVHLDTTISQRIKHGEEEKEDEDTVSVSTTSTDNCDGAVVLQDAEDKAPCFQNIEVTNSSDVHFGNKTYYQGPVTIKQILYNNRDGEKLPVANGAPPQLAINDKCVVDNVNYANYNAGYTTDSAHPITTNGNTKLPNGIHNPFNAIRGTGDRKLTRTQWIIIGVGIAIAVLLGAVTLVLIFTLGKSNKNDSTTILGDADDSDPGYEPSLPPGLRLISRADWGAIPPKEESILLKTPVPYVIIHHTATSTCFTLAICKRWAIDIQKFHMDSNGWDDIGYNFMVGGDGYAYEGRGWTNLGAHAKGYNNVSIGIAFIGTFTNYLPKKYQMEEAQELIKEGVAKGYISENYKLLGMNQVSTFESPGRKLIEEIKTWPHFAKTP